MEQDSFPWPNPKQWLMIHTSDWWRSHNDGDQKMWHVTNEWKFRDILHSIIWIEPRLPISNENKIEKISRDL